MDNKQHQGSDILNEASPSPSSPKAGWVPDPFFASLFHTYTHSEWSRITSYSIQTLHNFASEGHPAWRRSRWHPVAWALWTAGIAQNPKKGRKSIYEQGQGDKLNNAVLTLVGVRS